MKTCSEEDCDRKHYARGLCKRHYLRAWTRGEHVDLVRNQLAPTATLDERLRHHGWTVTDSDCWEWAASLNTYGYGQLAVGGTRPEAASRVAYAAWVGEIPDGGVVCHRCDNPPCINPDHLFLGTKAINNRDMADKQRSANGERKAHKLTDAHVEAIRDRYAAGGVAQRTLAREYGVSQQLVSHLVRRTRRAHRTYGRGSEREASGIGGQALSVGE